MTYQLVDWLNMEDIHWVNISRNSHPRAIELLRENPDKIYYEWLAENPAAKEIFDEWFVTMDAHRLDRNYRVFEVLCANPATFHLFYKIPPNAISDYHLSQNPAAIDYLLENPHRISWQGFYMNPHPQAMRIITERMEMKRPAEDWQWSSLAQNPAAFHLIQDRIMKTPEVVSANEWMYLSKREDMVPIFELESHKKYINWPLFARNPAAIDILRECEDRFEPTNGWRKNLWANPAIFERVMPAFKNAAGCAGEEA